VQLNQPVPQRRPRLGGINNQTINRGRPAKTAVAAAAAADAADAAGLSVFYMGRS